MLKAYFDRMRNPKIKKTSWCNNLNLDMNNKEFRADINGLRAIAVIAVVMFHFNKNWLPGGFAGVDVFFVISGYLMTLIIFRGIEKNNFSYRSFLYSRIKRIVPPLMAIIAILLIFGFLFLEPMSYKSLGKHSLRSLLFISNIAYYRESGYFDITSIKKLLLHTWSLSVEWQFYIIYPILLVLFKKILSMNSLKYLCLFGLFISFLISLYSSKYNPSFSYFMLQTRAWELLFGGLAFLFPLNLNEKTKKPITLIGLSFVIASFFIVKESDLWPGYMSLIPVFGTYLCILSGKGNLLSLPPLQIIGKYSYSIYLTHWSLLAILSIQSIKVSFLNYIILIAIFSFLLFVLIESKKTFTKKHASIFMILLLTSYLISLNGFIFRVPEQFKYSSSEYHDKYYGGSGYESNGSVHQYNNSYRRKLIMSGDSFSRQYSNFLSHKKINIITIFSDGCFSSENYMSTFGDDSHKKECSDRYDNLIETMKNNPTADVLYAQNWSIYTVENKSNGDNLQSSSIAIDVINEIIKKGGNMRTYYIIGLPPNNDPFSYYECTSRAALPINKLFSESSCPTYFSFNRYKLNMDIKNNLKVYSNVVFIDPYDALCTNSQCKLIDDDGNAIYSDTAHLSIQGADYVGKSLLNKYFD